MEIGLIEGENLVIEFPNGATEDLGKPARILEKDLVKPMNLIGSWHKEVVPVRRIRMFCFKRARVAIEEDLLNVRLVAVAGILSTTLQEQLKTFPDQSVRVSLNDGGAKAMSIISDPDRFLVFRPILDEFLLAWFEASFNS